MTKVEEILSRVRSLVFADQPAPAPAPADPSAQFSDYTLEDGTVISVSELAVGGTVMVGDQPAPAGDHKLSDGTIITVGDGGVITDVKGAEAAPEMPEDMQHDYSEQFASIETRFAAMDETIRKQGEMLLAFDAALKQSSETIRQMLAAMEELAKVPTADPAEQPKQAFAKPVESKIEKYGNLLKAIKK